MGGIILPEDSEGIERALKGGDAAKGGEALVADAVGLQSEHLWMRMRHAKGSEGAPGTQVSRGVTEVKGWMERDGWLGTWIEAKELTPTAPASASAPADVMPLLPKLRNSR